MVRWFLAKVNEMTRKQNEFDTLMTMTDLSQYIDKWIALVGDTIVAVGDSGKSVFLEAKGKHPDIEPFIMKVPRNEVMLL